MITLDQALNLQNVLGHGVNVCFCSSKEHDFIREGLIECRTFSEAKDKLKEYKLGTLEVFRIDTLNDVICFYVVQQKR